MLAVALLFLAVLYFLTFPSVPPRQLNFQLEERIRHDCQEEVVSCIGSCDYLCTEQQLFTCTHNVCARTAPNIPCDALRGGMTVLVKVPRVGNHWECVCLNPHVYGGPSCDDANPNFCRMGVVVERESGFGCECPAPNFKYAVNNFAYCEELPKNFKLKYLPPELEKGVQKI